MSWEEFERAAPLIARLGRRLLASSGVVFLATTRPDGSPRIHPVCPVLCDGELLLGLIDRSPKCRDLHRDPRCVVHALPGPGNAEFWVEAVAQPQPPGLARRWAERDQRLTMPPGDTLFRLHLYAAHGTIFQPGQNNMPVPMRRHWRRAGTGAPRAATLFPIAHDDVAHV